MIKEQIDLKQLKKDYQTGALNEKLNEAIATKDFNFMANLTEAITGRRPVELNKPKEKEPTKPQETEPTFTDQIHKKAEQTYNRNITQDTQDLITESDVRSLNENPEQYGTKIGLEASSKSIQDEINKPENQRRIREIAAQRVLQENTNSDAYYTVNEAYLMRKEQESPNKL